VASIEDRVGDVLDVLLRLASGDFSARAEVTGEGDIVDAVAAGINMLGEEIEAHDERLQAAVRRQTMQLQEQNQQLETLDKHRTHLFQNASHELRTPLTLILGPLDDELIEHPDNDNLQLIDRNARRLLRLVNQLLDYQRLSAGHTELDNGPLELTRFLRVCADYFRSAASSHELTFRCTVAGEPLATADELFVWSEADALEKVVFNYLSNALKFTPNGGTIDLTVQRREGAVRLAVSDTGPGISEADQARLFEVFVQADSSARLQHQGTGLGLALVKELVQAMGGTVGVTSQPGEGATFWCDLQPSVPAPFNRELYELRGGGMADVVAPRAVVDEEPTEGTNGVVLVVDDLDDVRALLSRSILRAGYSVVTARNGLEALDILTMKEIDLVITDWMMPLMTGPELIQSIRADAALQGTPVVLLTARSDEESRVIGLGVGADAYLGKPFLDAELTATVRNLVALKHKEREVTALNRYLSENVLKRYLPPELVDDLLTGDASVMEQPRNLAVTILFADLVGFTSMSHELEPEEVTSLLNAYFTAITEVAFEHGATIDKFIGDGVMLLFGAPHEMPPAEQALRAARCAQGIHAALRTLAATSPLEHARVGLHHGSVIVGNVGSALRSDYTAIGRDVNLASRIESACLPGRTWVSGAVADLLPAGWTHSVGVHPLKGIIDTELFELGDVPA
jgi:signal transduction histidine kinase/class 3 adenylate cyclase